MLKKDIINFDVPEDTMICDLFMQQAALACATAADATRLLLNGQ